MGRDTVKGSGGGGGGGGDCDWLKYGMAASASQKASTLLANSTGNENVGQSDLSRFQLRIRN